MWELDHKESWALKNWWFWVVVLEKTLESLLDCREINQLILSKLQELVMDRGSLIYCSPWDHEESHMSKQANWAEPLIMVRGQLCSGGWEWKRLFLLYILQFLILHSNSLIIYSISLLIRRVSEQGEVKYIYIYIYSFIPKMFIQQLQCGKNCSRHWRKKDDNSGT